MSRLGRSGVEPRNYTATAIALSLRGSSLHQVVTACSRSPEDQERREGELERPVGLQNQRVAGIAAASDLGGTLGPPSTGAKTKSCCVELLKLAMVRLVTSSVPAAGPDAFFSPVFSPVVT